MMLLGLLVTSDAMQRASYSASPNNNIAANLVVQSTSSRLYCSMRSRVSTSELVAADAREDLPTRRGGAVWLLVGRPKSARGQESTDALCGS